MTIGEIIDGLNRRESIAIIAKRLEISPYTLSKKLRLIGYEYDGEQKKRIFVGDGEEPRHLQLQEATALQYAKTDYQLLIYEQLQSIYELLRKKFYKAYDIDKIEKLLSQLDYEISSRVRIIPYKHAGSKNSNMILGLKVDYVEIDNSKIGNIVIGISNFDDKEYSAILSPRVLETI